MTKSRGNSKLARAVILALLALVMMLALNHAQAYLTPQREEVEHVRRILENGNELARQGNFRDAVKYYKDVIEKWPDFYQVYNLLGFCYVQLNELQVANEYFRKAVQLNPGFIEARNNLGANYLALNQLQKATEQFEEVLKLDPKNVSALYNIAVAEMKLNLWEQAAGHLERAHILVPSDIQISIDLVEARLKSGKTKSAIDLVNLIASRFKDDGNLHFTLGLILMRNGLADRAKPLIRSAHNLIPEVADRVIALANEYYNKEQYQTVIDLLESLDSEKMENSAVWHGMLGYTFYKLDRIEEAINELQKAIRLDPKNEDYYLDLGEVFGANRAYYAAIALFEAAIKILPGSEKLEFALALSHQLSGNREKCIEILQGLLKKNPSFEAAYKVLAESYDGGGEWNKLLEVALQLKQLNDKNYWGWYFEAKARFELGRTEGGSFDDAEKALKRALQLKPSEPEGHYLLGKIRYNQGLYLEAIELLKKVTEIKPEHASTHYLLANAYKRIGKKDLSDKEFDIYQRLKEEERNRRYRGLLVEIHR